MYITFLGWKESCRFVVFSDEIVIFYPQDTSLDTGLDTGLDIGLDIVLDNGKTLIWTFVGTKRGRQEGQIRVKNVKLKKKKNSLIFCYNLNKFNHIV